MKNSKMAFLMSLLIGIVVLGCAKKDDDAAGTKTELEGTWSLPCTQFDTAEWGTYEVFVEGANLTFTGLMYSDSGCTILERMEVQKETFTVGAASTTAEGAKQFNHTTVSVSFTPLTNGTASTMNTNSECGINTWASGTAQDVTGKTCPDETFTAGDVKYDLFKIDTTVTPNTLQFGDHSSHDMESEATRPVAIDTSMTLTKK